MRYIKGHAARSLKRWAGKEWYHQRFDGSPYFLFLVGEGEMFREQRKRGTHFDVHYCFFNNDHADWYILMDDIKRISDIMISLGKKNPNISSDMMEEWKKDEQKFIRRSHEISGIEFTRLSDDELIKLHDNFSLACNRRFSSSSTIDGFALGTDTLIADNVKEYYDILHPELKFTEAFSILTAPTHLSFVNDAEISLFKISLAVQKAGLKELFLRADPEKIIEEVKKDSELYGKIASHQESFFWITNNYVDDIVLQVEYFVKEIKKLLGLDINLGEVIKKISGMPQDNKKKKEQLIRSMGLDQELKTLLKISEDFTHWQDERKKSTLLAIHYMSLIFSELSRRTDIDISLMKYMSSWEIRNIFKEKPDKKVLEQRRKNSVFYVDSEGIEAVCGKDADNVKEELFTNSGQRDVDDFRGLTACTGKVIGKVKVVKSVKEIGKVEIGDILVAVMTRPDYVPAMKKAAAIVTDEGGITSHAAIVSRELGVPCIIGTKIATKVLKDGLTVQVNANHGWVKIIR